MTEVLVEGPYFEDFSVGQFLPKAPSITLTDGYAVAHQMLFGDRLRLPLDHHFSEQITGGTKPLG